MTTINRDYVREVFRERVLEALDSAARQVFPHTRKTSRNDIGANDSDLPALFRAIDAQLDRLCERYDLVLVDYATEGAPDPRQASVP